MQSDFTKSERKRIRQLASLAWQRGLRIELRKIAVAIEEMECGRLTPFDVTDLIHRFHNGAARDLYKQFSGSLPWLDVCRAHYDHVLTDDDIVDASDNIRDGIREFATVFARLDSEAEADDRARTDVAGPQLKCMRSCRPEGFRPPTSMD